MIKNICSHFEKEYEKDKIWFSGQDDKPIQWHLPIGFLYDIACTTSNSDELLPWKIVVRFSKFPHNTILELANGKAAEENFFHSLKQALYIQYGSAKSVMSITRAEQSELWDAVMRCTLLVSLSGLYSPALTKLDFSTIPGNYFEFKDSCEKFQTEDKIRHVAVRVFNGDLPLSQKSLTFETESDGLLSLQSALLQFPRASEAKRMVIQGINVSKLCHLPLESIYKTFRHPDNFLYVVFDF